MPTFSRYIGIDYSGAKTPTASVKGLRVYADVAKKLDAAELRVTLLQKALEEQAQKAR